LHEREKILIPNVQYLPKTVNDPTDGTRLKSPKVLKHLFFVLFCLFSTAHKLEREHQRASKRFQMVTKCTDLAEISFYMEGKIFEEDISKAELDISSFFFFFFFVCVCRKQL